MNAFAEQVEQSISRKVTESLEQQRTTPGHLGKESYRALVDFELEQFAKFLVQQYENQE